MAELFLVLLHRRRVWAYAVVLFLGGFAVAYGAGVRVGPRGLAGLVSVDVRALGWMLVALSVWLLLRRASSAPRVFARPGGLRAVTAPAALVTSLAGWRRELLVDAKNRRIYVRSRRAWLWSTDEQVRFRDVEYVDYRHHGGSGGLETFDVSLVLRDRRRVHLFDFKGELVEGESATEEESVSRVFVRRLTSILGVGMGPSVKRRLEPA